MSQLQDAPRGGGSSIYSIKWVIDARHAFTWVRDGKAVTALTLAEYVK